MQRATRAIALALGIAFAGAPAGTAAQEPSADDATRTAEGTVARLYELVTFDPGATPDWSAVRSLFVPETVVVLRTSRTASTQFTLDGFVQDFITFIERANVAATGFSERILRTSPTVFRDIAHVLVLYEAHIPGSPRPPQQGVDSFQLVKKDGRWWIVSVVNDLPSPEYPVPAALR